LDNCGNLFWLTVVQRPSLSLNRETAAQLPDGGLGEATLRVVWADWAHASAKASAMS
jgi:hypothetical protein